MLTAIQSSPRMATKGMSRHFQKFNFDKAEFLKIRNLSSLLSMEMFTSRAEEGSEGRVHSHRYFCPTTGRLTHESLSAPE